MKQSFSLFLLVIFCWIGTSCFSIELQIPYTLQKYKTKYVYYYYPHSNIYYNPLRKEYYVWKNPHWITQKQVSNKSLGNKITLYLETTKPYYYNEQHRKKYRQ